MSATDLIRAVVLLPTRLLRDRTVGAQSMESHEIAKKSADLRRLALHEAIGLTLLSFLVDTST